MKIYPSKHRIKQIAESNIDKDIAIPLAYINNEHVSYSITRKVHDDFSISSKTFVVPGQELLNQDILLFDEYGNPAESSTVINRVEDKYYYHPNNMVEFLPLMFSYNVVAQKNLHYSIANKFNLNIACLDDEKRLNFLNRLSKILSAPSDKKYLPNNILINDNDTDIEVFKKVDYEKTDFIFVESQDGGYFNFEIPPEYIYEQDEVDSEISNRTIIPYSTFLDSCINTWVISDEHYQYPITRGTGIDVELKKPVITSEKVYHIRDYYNISDAMFRDSKIHNIFGNDICPILIVEHPNQGFTIHSSSEIFEEEKINYFRGLIYEVLMYVYCISYKKSRFVDEYITYDMPDYEIVGGSLIKKTSFLSKTSLNDLLKLGAGKYRICLVNIIDNNKELALPKADSVSTVDHVSAIRISNNKLVFKLDDTDRDNGIYKEAKKPAGWTSIYYNDKIYYLEKLHYLIETNIGKYEDSENKLYLIERDIDLDIRLYPFKSSKHGLNITKDLRLTIPFIKTTVNGVERIKNENYIIYMDLDKNELRYIYEDEYEESPSKAYMALVSVSEKKNDQYLTDMRQRGGGLPEDMPDNFNLLDIGHIYGRPYRKANTLVITLPKKYEPYKNEILEVINKYKVAEDYPILFFEDEDGEI